MDYLTEQVFNKSNDMISSIIDQEVSVKSFTSIPPVDDKLTDSNSVYKGKVSVLFVDMRNSTEFTDKNNWETRIKTYRSYLKIVTYAIRLSGGYVRDYTGDGILAVFCDDEESDTIKTSELKAINAGKLAHTLINYSLNPILTSTLKGIAIACGIGISTGYVSITKVGMRGREADESAENETGTIWICSCTNHASKLCSVSKANEIVIDQDTCSSIKNEKWHYEQRIKGDKIYDCYCLPNAYLETDEKIPQSPVFANIQSSTSLNIVDEIQRRLQEIQNEAEKLGVLKQDIEKKQKAIIDTEAKLNKKEQTLNRFYKTINQNAYHIYIDILRESFLKTEHIKKCGKDFWIDIIKNAKEYGINSGLSNEEINKSLCCYCTNIFETFQDWEKAYDYLCLMAKLYSWINVNTIERIVTNSGHYLYLKQILEERLKEPLEHDVYVSMKNGLDKLKAMGY